VPSCESGVVAGAHAVVTSCAFQHQFIIDYLWLTEKRTLRRRLKNHKLFQYRHHRSGSLMRHLVHRLPPTDG